MLDSSGTTKLLSNYNGNNAIVRNNTPLAAAKRHFKSVSAAKWYGYNNDAHAERAIEKLNNAAAVTACTGADAILLFLTDDACGEGKDRLQIALSAGQQSLVATVFNVSRSSARKVPVLAVLLTSGPVNLKLQQRSSGFKMAQHLDSRCVLLSDPSTKGAGGPNQNTSRLQHKEV